MNTKEAGIMEAGSGPGMQVASLSGFTKSLPGVITNFSEKRLVFHVPKETLGRKAQISHVCAF